ncbi:Eco57I restriction-modification methylase domain-containing protein [Microvirga tunisiensis]|uniref:Lactate dehydrogenase n=1 Tax=Microvirga tunisiensis TaxID=2108360 RepID=A0A5N7MPZ6_9HYPH|nr:helicase-related protein [Microvirga tunisiensis]MPR11135.1 lactate dehydrogenase [Microvirga tunisiensis]MPR28529.1 lactate dehydrogenase [Microvirga tunisiensis]
MTAAAMQIADQIEACWTINKSTRLNIDLVARKLGVSIKEARSRLKLAVISPRIVEAFRAGRIGLDQIEALTISLDHDLQERTVFEAINDWQLQPEQIKAVLSQGPLKETHKYVVFVGLDAYEAEGGTVIRDLLAEPGQGVITNRQLLVRLAANKIDTTIAQVREEGWKWVEAYPAEDPQLERIAFDHPLLTHGHPLESHDIPPHWLSVSGAFVGLNPEGSLKIERGLILPEDIEAAKAAPAVLDDPVSAEPSAPVVAEEQNPAGQLEPVAPAADQDDLTALDAAPAEAEPADADQNDVVVPDQDVDSQDPATQNNTAVVAASPSPAPAAPVAPAPVSVSKNYRIQPGEIARIGSWKATAERNVSIVELTKQIVAEDREATDDEKSLLTKYTGWGASEIANGLFGDQWGNVRYDWQDLNQRIRAALSDEEFAEAKRTTQYAHYTSEAIITGIFVGLAHMGFAGGSVLEPGMGIGLFNGLMPDAMAARSSYTGIEYDTVTAQIARLLYPSSNVITGDYAKTALPRDFFDVAIGNPPFSTTRVLNDPEYKKHSFLLHDYFIAKSLDRVRPGGLVVLITSKGTMDKQNSKARRYMAASANLLGAIRLPQTAFKENAGTEVVTDVLFLQKRGLDIGPNGIDWLETRTIDVNRSPATINQYFVDHPEMVLGSHAMTSSMYRGREYTVEPLPNVAIEDAFAAAVLRLPAGIYAEAAAPTAVEPPAREYNPRHRKEGGLYLNDDGVVMQVDHGIGVPLTERVNSTGKKLTLRHSELAWLNGFIGVRDALKKTQADQLNDGDWETSLKALNATYDTFVKKHGHILAYTTIERDNPDGTTSVTKRYKNEPLIRIDAEGALAYAMERIDEEGEIHKGAALLGRVLKRDPEPVIQTVQDALFVSLNRLGYFDIDHVAALANTGRTEAIAELGTAIYEDPAGAKWILADEYLSGNVVQKLKEAVTASALDPRFARNVEALNAVQPKHLAASDITVRLGANWIPPSDIEAFAKEIIGDRMQVSYNTQLGAWTVNCYSPALSEWSYDKMNSAEILAAVLNSKQIKITWRDDEGRTHVDVEATEKGNDIAIKMREAFGKWIWTDAERAERLVLYYNENFNNIAPRHFDGSHLTLPGLSMRFRPYPHQKRAIWRIIQQGDTYLAHAVGAGKTAEMICAGMEQRRLGLIDKPMYGVPNHMLAQFAREFLELYPSANIMIADEHNFHTANRRRFVTQAALNGPDAIVITHSAFGRIGMSDAFYEAFVGNQIAEWQAILADIDSSERLTRKQIERRIESLERRLEARLASEAKDKVLTFEELGVDFLFIDEAHDFRKLDFATNQGNIKGIDPNGSQRALDLFMKVEYIRSRKPGRAVVMASGTPITNTMGELFTIQRFFQPDQLSEDGLATFDVWAAQYGDVVAGFEQNAAGGYEIVSRFCRFFNVPELMRRVRSFMDILNSSQLGELIERPMIEGGHRQIIVTPAPEGYKAYQKFLETRIKAIRQRSGKPQPGDDIILSVIADGRFSAIDMRFVCQDMEPDPNSKLNRMLDDVIATYHETADYEYLDTITKNVDSLKGATSIVFSDIGLGEQSAANRGFDMKEWMRAKLVAGGVKPEHIAFMRDHKQHAKKERLFADMREGRKRILVGGRDMETGVNVQKRLRDLFHLDAPWFPASVQQREGRIERQGNQNSEIRIRAYATKGSYDSTMWGMNARKARFIEQAMNGDDSVRSLDDVSEASAFQMASALASGDERYMKVAGLRSDVERLERLRQAHNSEQGQLLRDRHHNKELIRISEECIAATKIALQSRQPIETGQFSAKVGSRVFDKRDDFGKALCNAMVPFINSEVQGSKPIGEIGGLQLVYFGRKHGVRGRYEAEVYLDIPGDPNPLVQFPWDDDIAYGGIATRAINQLNALEKLLDRSEDRIASCKRKLEQIKNRIGAPFPEEADLIEKQEQLKALEEELANERAAEAEQEAQATAEADGQDQDQLQADFATPDLSGQSTTSVNAYGEDDPPEAANDDLAIAQLKTAFGS